MTEVEKKFKVGDLVKIKSGGPVMVISVVKEETCQCVWFRGAQKEISNFSLDILEHQKNDKQ